MKECWATGKRGEVLTYNVYKNRISQNKEWNNLTLCLDSYRELQEVGFEKFVDKNPRIRMWLTIHGWYWHQRKMKWINKLGE